MNDQHKAIAMENISNLPACIECIRQAINRHDVEELADCFEPDYQSEFPAHPERAFRGPAQLRLNWSQMFSNVPDILAEVLRCVVDRDTVWAEWEWSGTQLDGTPFLWRGVSILGAVQRQTGWVRMYMEPVQPGGHDIMSSAQGGLQ